MFGRSLSKTFTALIELLPLSMFLIIFAACILSLGGEGLVLASADIPGETDIIYNQELKMVDQGKTITVNWEKRQ